MSAGFDLGNNIKVVTALPVANVTVTQGGKDVDARSFNAAVGKINIAAASAGSSPTLDIKLQESDKLANNGVLRTGEEDNGFETLRDATNSNIKFSMTVANTDGARQVKSIDLRIKKAGTITAGKKIWITLEGNSGSDPDGTALQNGTSVKLEAEDISTTISWVTFTFDQPVDIADATTYHVVLQGDYTVSATNAIKAAYTTVASAAEISRFFDSAWAALDTKDLNFKINQYNFSDVTSGAHTQVTTSALEEEKSFDLTSVKDYVRYYTTIGGTSSPAFLAAQEIVLGHSTYPPV